MWVIFGFLYGLLLLSFLSVGSAYAIGTPEDQGEDIFTLGEVVVSERLGGIEAAETVHEITAEQIKRSSARSLDEALVLLSDVNIQVGNEAVPRVSIRGFRTRHVLLLLDGIPMNSSFDQQFDPSSIPVENIAKIKVTAGASSVLYGQGGLGGVINIITKKGTQGAAGTASFEAGDGEPYLAKASLSGGKGAFDFFASGSAYKRDKFPLAESFNASVEEKEGYRKNSDAERNNLFLNVGYTPPSSNLYIAFTGNWVQGGYGKPASAINNKFDPYAPAPRFGRVDWYRGYTMQLAADYVPTKTFSVRSMLYYNRIDQDNNQYDNEDYDSFDDPFVPNSFKLRNTGINRGFSVQPKYDLGKLGALTLGFSGEWDTWIDTGKVKTGGDGGASGGHGIGGGSPPYVLYPVRDHYDLEIASTALEYQVNPLKNLGLASGIAYHWQFREDKNTSDFSLSSSLYYDLREKTRLKAAFMRNIRFPSLSQLYLRDSDNPDLKTEKVYQYQVGMEQKLPLKSLFKIDVFRSDAYNFIALDQNVTPAKNRNYSLYRFSGFETSMETSPLRNLLLKTSYTYLNSRDLSGVGRDEVQYVPKHKVSFIGKYDFEFGLTPFVSVIYVADSYVYSKQKIPTVLKAKMGDYVVVNLKFSQRLYSDRVLLYAGADNLLNKDYEQSYGIPRPGRFVYGGIEYHFSL